MSKYNSTLVYGTDPEYFAGYVQKKKLFVLPPAWFRVYGKVPYIPEEIKGHHVFIDEMKESGVLVMEDGVAFEFTVKPSSDWKELFERVQLGKRLLSERILSKFSNDCLPEIISQPTINFDVKRWAKENAEFRLCLIFGCDQDFDACNYNAPGKVIDALKHPFRYGGGHLHVSGSAAIKEEPILAVYSMLLTSGLSYVANSDTPELDKQRTYLYGRPGKYRIQEYSKLFNGMPNTDVGIEYRTPSNRWTSSIEQATQIFKWAEIGIKRLLEEGLVKELYPLLEKDAQKAIVECDQTAARQMLQFIETRI